MRPEPWPEERPAIENPIIKGWFGECHIHMFQTISETPRLILECGSFIGMSTLYMLERWPKAHLTCVDTWQGSPGHDTNPHIADVMDDLAARFQYNVWDERERVDMIRGHDPPATRVLALAGLRPDLVYLDGSHEYEHVAEQLAVCRRYWPDAIVTGDDFSHPPVRQAVEEHAQLVKRPILLFQGRAWRIA